MSDSFIPEHDALEQKQGFESVPVPGDPPALVYPDGLPPEANEADVIEQSQPVEAEGQEEEQDTR